jgi:hypothetical protein
MGALRVALAVFALAASGCAAYEYEEEVFLDADGSGRMRMSGSREILRAVHHLDRPGLSAMRSRFEGTGIEVSSVRETDRDGRGFIHVEARFEDWNGLCRRPFFERRRCRLEIGGDEIAFESSLPPPGENAPGISPDAILALRFHLPGTVRSHNVPRRIERGNILSWEISARDYFRGEPLLAEARFDRQTILRRTIWVLLAAVGLVLATIVLSVHLMVRRGRRELDTEARG